MTVAFVIIALVTLAGAVAALSLRNLVHCALALTVTFAGLAGIYLQLDAQFVGFAQVMVYIGAVAILLLFAILLTRGSDPPGQPIFSSSWWLGAGVALVVFGLLAALLLSSRALGAPSRGTYQPTVRQLGDQLMTHYLLPLEVLGLLLTAALIGAVLLAMNEGGENLSAASDAGPAHNSAAKPDSASRDETAGASL